jgi:hypothetical protein
MNIHHYSINDEHNQRCGTVIFPETAFPGWIMKGEAYDHLLVLKPCPTCIFHFTGPGTLQYCNPFIFFQNPNKSLPYLHR